MFHLSFTKSDAIRAVWTFIAAFVGAYVVVVQQIADLLHTSCTAGACDWSGAKKIAISAIVGAIAAAISAAKNAVLADGSTLKG